MELKIQRAYDRLKELEMFSEDFETFKNFFYDNLKADKKDEAIELLLMVVFTLFKAPGEKFNLLLTLSDKETNSKLLSWLDTNLKKVQQ